MIGSSAGTQDEAIHWAIRAQDAAFDDWEALADWLAVDPEHALLYDRATIAADEGARAVAVVATRTTPFAALPTVRRRPRLWLPLAMAASVVAAVGAGLTLYGGTPAPAFYAVSTPAGGRQELALAGAVRMVLNGETRITLDRNDPRFARLERGQATFSVVHDPDHPFALHVGNTLVTDVGTVFDVERYGEAVRIAVGEGAVRVTTAAGGVAASAGTAVEVDANGTAVVQRDQDVHEVGAWRGGQVDFADISLARLALRLHRASGARITVAPDIASRRVTGSVVLDGDRDATLRELSAVLGIKVALEGDVWMWSARTVATPS